MVFDRRGDGLDDLTARSYVVLLEHYPADQDPHEGGHLYQVPITGHGSRWRRIWPTPASNPDHGRFGAWMDTPGQRMLAEQIPSHPR